MTPDDPSPSPTPEAAQPDGPPATPPPPEPAAPPRRPRDPWAHRRGEPRTFAFLWAVFLFTATLTTFGKAVAGAGLSHDVIRPAARTLLVITAAGVTFLWPLVRLSQARDRKPLAGAVQDAVVVLVPVHAIVWPQALPWLAGWPLPVVALVALSLTAWALVVAGLLAVAQSWRPLAGGAFGPVPAAGRWMAGIVGVQAVALALGLLTRPMDASDRPRAHAPAMLSAIGSVLDLTRDRPWTGRPAAAYPLHGIMTLLTATAAVPLWVSASRRVRRWPLAALSSPDDTTGPNQGPTDRPA